MKYINLTPHAITLDVLGTLPSEGIARVTEKLEGNGMFKIRTYGKIEGLPEQQKDVIYIVSTIVMSQAVKQGRTDVYSPCEFVRDEQGRIVGCKSLCQDSAR